MVRSHTDFWETYMLLEQAIADANSAHPETAEWGFSELEDLAQNLQKFGRCSLFERAVSELAAIKQRPMVTGVLFNGMPLCLNNFPIEAPVPAAGKHQETMRRPCPTRSCIIVPFWVYRRRQFPGPTALRKIG